MIAEELEKAISEAMRTLGVEAPEVALEHPADFAHGDYSTNAALVYAKELKMKPRELAEKLIGELQNIEYRIKNINKIEVAGAGFINFHFAPSFFSGQVITILREGNIFGRNAKRKGQKIFFEYTQPNPFKEFHIGHLMNNVIGESVSRALEWSGATVKRATYHGDVGLHVAKAIFGMKKQIRTTARKIQETTVKEWGEAYQAGSEAYETDALAKKEINELNKKIYERSDPAVNTLYEIGRRVSLAHFEELYRRLGSVFDFNFFESEAGVLGKKIVEEQVGGVFERSEGAVVYKGEKHGLHTRVFLNSEGLPTYEAKEIGLAHLKDRAFDLDFAITVTANEQNDFFRVVEKAIGEVFPRYDGKMRHLSHGMLRLPSGKMSSRAGTIISAESLIAQVKELVMEKIKDREMTADEKEKLSEIVAVGAIKYSILRQTIGGDIIFDFEKSISFEGDSGPYLQYSYARAKSVLAKARNVLNVIDDGTVRNVVNVIDDEEARRTKHVHPIQHLQQVQHLQPSPLERLLYRFPEVVARAADEYEPHHIATYLTELAGAFNGWYAKEKIIGSGEEEPYRLALTRAFAAVIKNGLWLLGIGAPEKM